MDYTQLFKDALVLTLIFVILHVIIMQVDESTAMSHAGIIGAVAVSAALAGAGNQNSWW